MEGRTRGSHLLLGILVTESSHPLTSVTGFGWRVGRQTHCLSDPYRLLFDRESGTKSYRVKIFLACHAN